MIDDIPIRAYKRYEINTETFRAMGVEPLPKFVNRELNSQIDIRTKIHILVKVMGLPLHPCSYGVLHTVSGM